AVADFTMFSVEHLDKTEAHKSLHWIARLCASLECDMFDNKKLAQEDKNHLALMLCLRSLILSK
ncbi:hypothetical protein ACRU1G_003949, partial [Escherichia coli]|nr:hypothetical protein [Salmonella enterica subsp. enterica serovar Derby]